MVTILGVVFGPLGVCLKRLIDATDWVSRFDTWSLHRAAIPPWSGDFLRLLTPDLPLIGYVLSVGFLTLLFFARERMVSTPISDATLNKPDLAELPTPFTVAHKEWLAVPRLRDPRETLRKQRLEQLEDRRLEALAEAAEEELKLKRNEARPVVLPELAYTSADDIGRFALYVRNVGTRTAREFLVSAMVIGSHHMTFEMIQILTPSDNGKEVHSHVYQPIVNAYGPGNHISFNDAIKSVENVYLTGMPRNSRVVADQVLIPFTITYTDAHAGTEYSEAHELVFADPEVHVVSWLVRSKKARK